ncbi:MAG TPA: FxDxF family PEP-CTERM protein, partial [Burkholderiaceae bacterium]|nr:FxDxF family PEP-CTERM protein [Burkholderiaceae bacterium]
PWIRAIGNSFQGEQAFDDCYNFSLSNSAEAFGLTLEWDASMSSGIDIEQVSLSGGSLVGTVVDDSPGWFSFSHLLAGTYQLIVSGDVTSWGRHGSGSVGYYGLLATANSGIAAPLPEPDTFALLAMALAIAAWSAKRRKV